MFSPGSPSWFGPRLRPRVQALTVALLVVAAGFGGIASAAPASGQARSKSRAKTSPAAKSARASKSAGHGAKGRAAASGGSDSLFRKPSNVVPNQQGKIVLFTFRNDDDSRVSTQVGHLLEARGLEVVTGVRPVDSAEQYRDLATALDLVAFVDGDVRGTDAKSRATIRVRSGLSGRKTMEVAFTESRSSLPRELSAKLWTRVGPAVARACADVINKPRKKSRNTLQINAGTPIETTPASSNIAEDSR